MSWFDAIFGKKNEPPMAENERDRLSEMLRDGRSGEDHLGLAAVARRSALDAVRERRFDDAWRLFHEQKQHYMQHAMSQRFTALQLIALDGSVHEDLANIQRLEGRHDDALVHILYCVISSSRPTKAQAEKLAAYFNRCRFSRVEFAEVDALVNACRAAPDLKAVQTAVASWRAAA